MPTPGDAIPAVLRSGTIEYLLVTVGDHLDFVNDLAPLNPAFVVYDPNDLVMQALTPADVNAATPMIARCNVNTTTGGGWPSNRYRLYLQLTAAPEAPILGPIIFRVQEL